MRMQRIAVLWNPRVLWGIEKKNEEMKNQNSSHKSPGLRWSEEVKP